jgi:hypothetical protein
MKKHRARKRPTLYWSQPGKKGGANGQKVVRKAIWAKTTRGRDALASSLRGRREPGGRTVFNYAPHDGDRTTGGGMPDGS